MKHGEKEGKEVEEEDERDRKVEKKVEKKAEDDSEQWTAEELLIRAEYEAMGEDEEEGDRDRERNALVGTDMSHIQRYLHPSKYYFYFCS